MKLCLQRKKANFTIISSNYWTFEKIIELETQSPWDAKILRRCIYGFFQLIPLLISILITLIFLLFFIRWWSWKRSKQPQQTTIEKIFILILNPFINKFLKHLIELKKSSKRKQIKIFWLITPFKWTPFKWTPLGFLIQIIESNKILNYIILEKILNTGRKITIIDQLIKIIFILEKRHVNTSGHILSFNNTFKIIDYFPKIIT